MKALLFIAKQWPVLVLAYSVFASWSLFNAHQNNTRLRGENSLLNRKWEAADAALAKHSQSDDRIVAQLADRVALVDALPDDGCLDSPLPDGY